MNLVERRQESTRTGSLIKYQLSKNQRHPKLPRMLIVRTLLLALLLVQSIAHANPVEPDWNDNLPPETDTEVLVANENVPSHLRLLGRGLRRRGGDESIALACYGDDKECKTVRFVYFSATKQPSWAGNPFVLSQGNARLRNLEVKAHIRSRNPDHDLIIDSQAGKVIGPLVIFVATPSAVMLANAVATATAPAVAIALAPAAVFLLYDFLSYGAKMRIVSSRELGTFSIEHGTDGWNWASRPAPISKKRFDRLVQAVNTTTRNYNWDPGLWRLEKRIERLQKAQ